MIDFESRGDWNIFSIKFEMKEIDEVEMDSRGTLIQVELRFV